MELSWARGLRDECQTYDVAFFMKQLGSVYARTYHLHNAKGEDITEFPSDLQIQEFPRIASEYQEIRASKKCIAVRKYNLSPLKGRPSRLRAMSTLS